MLSKIQNIHLRVKSLGNVACQVFQSVVGPLGPILVACDRFVTILIIQKMDHRAQCGWSQTLFCENRSF